MKTIPKHAIMLIQLESGEMVQRPLRREEMNFVFPLLQEFDGGEIKVLPVPDRIVLEKLEAQ